MTKTACLLGMILLCASGTLLAKDSDFNVVFEKKRLDVERRESLGQTISAEEWGYGVTIENKSFKDQDGLTAKYMLFVKDVGAGGASTRKGSGSFEIGALENNKKNVFTTNGIGVLKQQVKAGYYYKGTARSRLGDSLSGIWLLIYKGGELMGEYSSPQGLPSREKWEEGGEKQGKKKKQNKQ